ncbi:related to ISA1 - Fe/S cluster assembly protein [Melanopsichium pennsylvanicum]|uniref:Iron-sulfur assembly protein 1 n=2 Tax=Melanopsichium pennsylvanicum TaxID=63383 RepID=A0AAJ4XI80_9BASI|nr:related to ISA1-Fe/S cluster assembly protein [Melanopsichium pennsylvanicum 4]SNX82196.1 related to ISA1 - Fe/S cluster assembly protein [Melanopsichium pennsylvanicum]
MSIHAASLATLANASKAALLPFLYPSASRSSSSTAFRFASSASSSSLRASSSRHTLSPSQIAASSQWFTTSVGHLSPASSSSVQSQTASYPCIFTPSSHSSPPFTSASTSSSSRSGAQKTETASVDPACATLSPSSPASPKSQKDPRVSTATSSELPAPTPSPATPAPSASDPAPSSNLTPSKATELVKGTKVAASMPEASSSVPAAPKKASSDRGTKFRSRTAALKLTPTAVLRLRALMNSESGPKLIRVGVRNKGCAGMSYHLEYIKPEEAGRFDERVKQDGVDVLIDSKALFSIIGSEMDWQEDRLSAKFVFNNPNVKEACGCGESFLT